MLFFLIANYLLGRKETSYFYLLFREMTMTMDDVSSLFHLPIADRFFTASLIIHMKTLHQVVKDLQVTKVVVLPEFDANRGAHLRTSWLQDMYYELVKEHRYEVAARAYKLHLMVSTLFTDKSHD